MIRFRQSIEEKYGGRSCTGPSNETMACNESPCPGKFTYTVSIQIQM